jgi:hypothetical protein
MNFWQHNNNQEIYFIIFLLIFKIFQFNLSDKLNTEIKIILLQEFIYLLIL